jgi:hypothetical protein
MTALRIGQRVVCIKDNWIGMHDGEVAPCKDAIYTVREIIPSLRFPEDFYLRLNEIKNPPLHPLCPHGPECAFNAQAFRPIIERKTDISVFLAMLVPAKQRKPEEIA